MYGDSDISDYDIRKSKGDLLNFVLLMGLSLMVNAVSVLSFLVFEKSVMTFFLMWIMLQ